MKIWKYLLGIAALMVIVGGTSLFGESTGGDPENTDECWACQELYLDCVNEAAFEFHYCKVSCTGLEPSEITECLLECNAFFLTQVELCGQELGQCGSSMGGCEVP